MPDQPFRAEDRPDWRPPGDPEARAFEGMVVALMQGRRAKKAAVAVGRVAWLDESGYEDAGHATVLLAAVELWVADIVASVRAGGCCFRGGEHDFWDRELLPHTEHIRRLRP